MTISEIKQKIRDLHKFSMLAFNIKPLKLDTIYYVFTEPHRKLRNAKEVEEWVGADRFTFEGETIYLNKGQQCLLFDNPSFAENEIECTYMGCSTVIQSDEDLFDVELSIYDKE